MQSTVTGPPRGAQEPQKDERRNFARNKHAPKFARTYARVRLGEWQLRHLAPSVEQVVTELATNAVQHSGGLNIMLWLTLTDTSVIVHVWDSCADLPAPRTAGDDDESGRGLTIVSAFSSRTGCYPYAGGKVIWAEIMR